MTADEWAQKAAEAAKNAETDIWIDVEKKAHVQSRLAVAYALLACYEELGEA